MTKLGPNLAHVLQIEDFNMTQSLALFSQLIDRLQTLHSIGYTHGNLTLENLCFSLEDPSKLFLIDFSDSTKFVNENGIHIK